VELHLGSVPSIANAMVPNAVAQMRWEMPDIALNIELLKIEEAIDYLLLQRGELVLMSYELLHPALTFTRLAHGSLKFVVPPDHPCASYKSITVEEIANYSLIGIDPNDPYGRIMAELFERANLDVHVPIKARFGSTVISLVERHVGVAVLDSFSVAGIGSDRLRTIPIEAETRFPVYYATRNDWTLSSSAEKFLRYLRATMKEHG
jgi:DNA-binding transcriptional LysR family regulator